MKPQLLLADPPHRGQPRERPRVAPRDVQRLPVGEDHEGRHPPAEGLLLAPVQKPAVPKALYLVQLPEQPTERVPLRGAPPRRSRWPRCSFGRALSGPQLKHQRPVGPTLVHEEVLLVPHQPTMQERVLQRAVVEATHVLVERQRDDLDHRGPLAKFSRARLRRGRPLLRLLPLSSPARARSHQHTPPPTDPSTLRQGRLPGSAGAPPAQLRCLVRRLRAPNHAQHGPLRPS